MTAITSRSTMVELEESTDEGKREMAAARAEVRVSHLLRKAFRLAGLSQRELADRLGVSAGRVSQILNSDGNIRVATAARYLRAMGYLMEIDAEVAEDGVPSLKRTPRRTRRQDDLHVFAHQADGGGQQSALLITDQASVDGIRPTELIYLARVTNVTGDIVTSARTGTSTPAQFSFTKKELR